jgi:hypothetical protein
MTKWEAHRWITQHRHAWKHGLLPLYKAEILLRYHFVFDPQKKQREGIEKRINGERSKNKEFVNKICGFIDYNQHCVMPRPRSSELIRSFSYGDNLFSFVDSLRVTKEKNTSYYKERLAEVLYPADLKRLENTGFCFHLDGDRFSEKLCQLVRFFNMWGDFNVPQTDIVKGFTKLHAWILSIQTERKNGTLKKEESDKLESIQFPWTQDDIIWDAYFRNLLKEAESTNLLNKIFKDSGKTKLETESKTIRNLTWIRKRSITFCEHSFNAEHCTCIKNIGEYKMGEWLEKQKKLFLENKMKEDHRNKFLANNLEWVLHLNRTVQNA